MKKEKNEKNERSAKDVSFENDPGFFYNDYEPTVHLANQAILKMLNAVRPNSPPGYHVAKAFTAYGHNYFGQAHMFPLRPFVQNKEYGPEYISAIAKNQYTDRARYSADCRKQSAKTKKASAEKETSDRKPSNRPLHQIKTRYKEYPSNDDVMGGATDYDWLYLQEAFKDKIRVGENFRQGLEKDLIKNVDALAAQLGLDAIDREIFKYLMAWQQNKSFVRLIKEISEEEDAQLVLTARILGIDKDEYLDRIGVFGSLNKKGLITAKEGAYFPDVSGGVYTVLKKGTGKPDDYIRNICGVPRKAELVIDDYPHLADDVSKAVEILKDALAHKKKGVNILIWGTVGTGKTELAATLGNEVAKKLYRPGEKQDGKHEILSRKQRFEALSLAQSLLKGSQDVIISLDEMEDFLQTGEEASPQGKAYFNRVLEENPIPVIWTVNSVKGFDPAVLRRFTWSIYAPPPPTDVRIKMYSRIAKRMGREITEDDATYMGKRYLVPPALIQKAFDADKIFTTGTNVDKKHLIASIENSASVLHGIKGAFEQAIVSSKDYDLGLANASVDNMPLSLEDLSDKLRGSKTPIKLLLFGEPGTGKTGFANHFGVNVLGKEIMVKEYSELSSAYVGESEKAIAAAFEQAHYEDKVLVINEADSFLRTRAAANKSWEITQVNEMLTQLEKTKVPVIMTTNLIKQMDPAVMRRFMFTIKLDTLKPDQVGRCYKSFFGRELPSNNALQGLKLAPGDFASVAEVFHAFKENMTDIELQSYLASKVTQRSDYMQQIGFGNRNNNPS